MKLKLLPSLFAGSILLSLLAFSAAAPAPENTPPRLLVLPWLVVDRTTNRECTSPAAPGSATNEARRLSMQGQGALDAKMHEQKLLEMVPRKEWQPHWDALQSSRVLWKGPGCAVCTPVGELIRYDRALVQQLAKQVRADYVWLGIAVVPLTERKGTPPADDCCREALAQERPAVLARGSVLLLRASDGEVVWQRDARRLERDVPLRIRRVRHPSRRRADAVQDTAHLLGKAFRREQAEALR